MANIQRWDPFAGLMGMHSQLDDLFNSLLSDSQVRRSGMIPSMDVYTDDDKQLVAEVQAPGFDKDDISLSVHDGVLEIKGEKHDRDETGKNGSAKGSKRNYMLRESHTSFYRSIALPRHADADNVQADFTNGVLKVSVPFKELPKPKKIAISGESSKTEKK
jgi:HSP20 family protein